MLAKTVARRTVVDARHALDAAAWRACGWDYRAPGRPGTPWPVVASAVPGSRGTTDGGTTGTGDSGITGTGDAERGQVEVACLAAAS